MKFSKKKYPVSEFLNRHKIISALVNISFYIILRTIRKWKSLYPYNTGNTLVIGLHRLGDTVFTIPAIKEIRKVYNKITVVCFPESVSIYNLAFNDVEFCTIEHAEFYMKERIANRSAKKKLKKLRPSLIIDLTGSMMSASLTYSLRAKKIIGLNRYQFRGIYDSSITGRIEPQLSDMYLDTVNLLIPVKKDNSLQKHQVSSNLSGKILIHPFAGWKEKEWGLKNYFNLLKKINENFDVSFIVPPGYLHQDLTDEIENSELKLILTESTEKLIQCIMNCSALIGNDSGPVNIANYLEKPTVTIYGATNPEYTATFKEYQIVVQKVVACSAASNEKYCLVGAGMIDCPGIECMNSLSVDDVFNQIIPLLTKYCKRKQSLAEKPEI